LAIEYNCSLISVPIFISTLDALKSIFHKCATDPFQVQ
jgi:hypothetical protein